MSYNNFTVEDILAFQADNKSDKSFDAPDEPQEKRTRHRLDRLKKIYFSLRPLSCFWFSLSRGSDFGKSITRIRLDSGHAH